MKKLLPAALFLICLSCLTEESADPGKASTFIRYYNGGFDDQAYTFEEIRGSNKGFIILATTQITDNNATIQQTKIKLIKTDQYGNVEWQTLYPDFNSTNPAYYKGRDMIVEKDNAGIVTGYTIVGDSIDVSTGVSYMFVIKANANGEFSSTERKSLLEDLNAVSLANIEGNSIAKDNNQDYLILGSRTDNATEDMVLAKLDKDDLSLIWSHEYGEGGTSNSNIMGLVSDDEGNIYWGGTVDHGNGTDIRLVQTEDDSEGAFGHSIGLSTFNEETGGIYFSPVNSSFTFVGTTDENGNRDILVKKIAEDGSEILFSDGSSQKVIGGESLEEGNAVCITNDGGPLIIGTTGVDDDRDYYLIKLGFSGDIKWSKTFGSKKADKGVGIMQTSDGSYVILGSTTLGGLSSILLMKTDSEGNVE